MKLFFPMTLCAILGCGLMAGLFFAFSVCVMRSLGRLPPEKGMVAMRSINVTILNPVFLSVFLVTGAACAFALVWAILHWQMPSARYLLAGSLFYLVGVLVVTGVFSVPMNNALDAARPNTPEGLQIWTTYLSNWTAWNHVRTVASLIATGLFAGALHNAAQP
jgi:uncharacterized membrane protein